MKGLVWLLVLSGLAVALALGVRYGEGYVLVVVPAGRMEISLALFVAVILAGFGVAHGLLRLLAATLALPPKVRAHRERVRRDQAAIAVQDAVRLLFEGRFGQALKRAGQAYGAGAARGLSALVAARAAQHLGEREKQQDWLERARDEDPRTAAAALMLEAEMLNESGRFPAALEILDRLQEQHGRHLAALRLELRARQGAGDWNGVLRLVRQLDKREALPPEVAREVKLQAHLHILASQGGDLARLRGYLGTVPAGERSPRLVAAAARNLIALAAGGEAQALIEAACDRPDGEGWNAELVALYGRIEGGELGGRIARAEDWLRQHPRDPGLLLTLGRLCLQQRLWGKAQSYLEASLAVGRTRAAHLELAQLFTQLQRDDEANRHDRAGAAMTEL